MVAVEALPQGAQTGVTGGVSVDMGTVLSLAVGVVCGVVSGASVIGVVSAGGVSTVWTTCTVLVAVLWVTLTMPAGETVIT